MSTQAIGTRKPLWWWALWVLLGLTMGAQALRMRVAEAAVEAGTGAGVAELRPQNGWALSQLAERQLQRTQIDAAIATSRAALERTPLSVVAIRTLARALDAKSPAGGEGAWQLASSIGWRDQPTQLWALLRALSNGQPDIFVMRADALMRSSIDPDPKMISVVRQAVLVPQIRQAIVKRIQLDPEWRERLFNSDRWLSPPELSGAVALLEDLGGTSAPPRREELRDVIRDLLAYGRFDEAVALDRRLVRRAADPGSLIGDGGFERLPEYRENVTPFDWTIVKSASLDRSGGRKSMLLASGHRRPLVRRFVALPGGSYRLRYQTSGSEESPASLGIVVRCAAPRSPLGSSPRQPLSGEGWQRREFTFAVPSGCPLVELDLTSFRGGAEADAMFDNIAIAPLAGGVR